MIPLLAALLLARPFQDGEDVHARLTRITQRLASVDPAERAAAAAEVHRLTREDVREKAKGTPEASIALAFLGDPGVRGEVAKLLHDPKYAAAAAEALGRAGPDSWSKELLKLAESDDPEIAFAAARAAAKSRSGAQGLKTLAERPEPRRYVVGAYGCELRKRGEYFRTYILACVSKDDSGAREFAIVALVNLPHAAEEVRSEMDETYGVRGVALKKVFQEASLRPQIRAILGRFLLRAGVYSYGDVVTFLAHADATFRSWARAMTPQHRSVLVQEAISRYSATTAELLEPVLRELTGLPLDEERVEDRLAKAKEWWTRKYGSTIDADVPKAIDDGVAWLKSKQQADGTWKYCQCGHKGYAAVDHTPGTTALVLYTLLKCGVSLEDKQLQRGFDYLLLLPLDKIPNAQTYTVALMAMVFGEAVHVLKSDRKTKDSRVIGFFSGRLRECAEWLIEAQVRLRRGGYEMGPWTYNKPAPKQESSDHSNTQFAMLGLLSARNNGIAIPAAVWQRALQWWLHAQMEDGGWPYVLQEDQRKTGSNSMSAAGMYCTLVAMSCLRKKDPKALTGEDPIVKVLGRMKKSYPVPAAGRSLQFGHVFSVYYDLYSLDRAMMISGTTSIEGRDWYRDGALFILYNQLSTGEWLDATDTCFALLFLKKAYIAVASGEGK
ncbi:MAG: terpene cyclase/mutase family protein [Planctomycetes bacterium]|nr:terpene cyclase/mutase family protein [Planctomycetota bacterium]